jgi:hypothetical protein
MLNGAGDRRDSRARYAAKVASHGLLTTRDTTVIQKTHKEGHSPRFYL